MHEDRLAKLDADIRQLEAKGAKPEPIKRAPPPPKPPLSKADRVTRRVLRWSFGAWGIVCFAALLAGSADWAWWEWLVIPPFCFLVLFGCYHLSLFEIELGKAAYRTVRSWVSK